MSTPSYLGAGQPSGNAPGLLGRLGSYFGNGGTPAYATVAPAAVATGGLPNGGATASKPAPVAATPESTPEVSTYEECEALMGCPIDPQALAEGRIAIVIPRLGP